MSVIVTDAGRQGLLLLTCTPVKLTYLRTI